MCTSGIPSIGHTIGVQAPISHSTVTAQSQHSHSTVTQHRACHRGAGANQPPLRPHPAPTQHPDKRGHQVAHIGWVLEGGGCYGWLLLGGCYGHQVAHIGWVLEGWHGHRVENIARPVWRVSVRQAGMCGHGYVLCLCCVCAVTVLRLSGRVWAWVCCVCAVSVRRRACVAMHGADQHAMWANTMSKLPRTERSHAGY